MQLPLPGLTHFYLQVQWALALGLAVISVLPLLSRSTWVSALVVGAFLLSAAFVAGALTLPGAQPRDGGERLALVAELEPAPPADGAAPADAPPFETNAALDWLVAQQTREGAWRSPEGGHDLATTALCSLAFIVHGHTHRLSSVGDYQQAMHRAVRYLRRGLDEVWQETRGAPQRPLFLLDVALATHALADVAQVSGDHAVQLDVIEARRRLYEAWRGGPWGWEPDATPNSLATAWAVMALLAIDGAGADALKRASIPAAHWLRYLTGSDGLIGYQRPGDAVSLAYGDLEDAPGLPLLTAAGVTASIFAGEALEDLEPSIDRLLEHLPHPDQADPAYWYLGTLAAFHALDSGDPRWERWDEALKASLRALQVREGAERGSFEPAGLFGEIGGRAATTALCVISKGVLYRYQRIADLQERGD